MLINRDQLDGVTKKDKLNQAKKRGTVELDTIEGTYSGLQRVTEGGGISFPFLACIQILSTCTKLVIVRTAVVILWAQAVALASQGRVVTIPII